jgi:hypothetical protein
MCESNDRVCLGFQQEKDGSAPCECGGRSHKQDQVTRMRNGLFAVMKTVFF